jgi:hypothetical protein
MKKLGFREADEMDSHIAFVAVRTSWIVTLVALLVWSIYDFFNEGTLTPPFILLSIGLAVYFLSTLYLRGKLGTGNQE